jgi:hypothetical protein
VSFLKGKVDNDKNAKVALDFARFVAGDGTKDKDLAVAFCNLMIGGTNMTTRAAMVSNPNVLKLLEKFKTPNSQKTFASRLIADEALSKLLSRTAWGTEKTGK